MKKYSYLILVLLLIVSCSHITQKAEPQQEQVTIKQEKTTEAPKVIQVEEEQTETKTVAAVTADIQGFAFNPIRLEIKKGTTVTWTNKDSAPHTVTGQFADSGRLNTGEAFSHIFNEVGEFEYICTIHPSMKGIVVVT